MFPSGNSIKSINRGILTEASPTATITAVDTSKTIIKKLGGFCGGTTNDASWVTLTNSTTVTADWVGTAATNTLAFEAIEFY